MLWKAVGLGCLGMVGLGVLMMVVWAVAEVAVVILGPVIERWGNWVLVMVAAGAVFLWLTAAIYEWLREGGR